MAGKLIRQLTDVEKKCAAKYRARMYEAAAQMQRQREILNDLALVFAGREGPVTMTEDALYEPDAADA